MHLFVYGTLTDPRCLDDVLGHRHQGERLSARLSGYARVTGEFPHPFVVEQPGHWVDGVLIMDLEADDVVALDRYEDVDEGVYCREHVHVDVFGCGPRALRRAADVYVAGPRLKALEKAGGMQDKVVYLTPEGKQRFMAELHQLQTVRRHEIEDQIRRAKEFSDTVDNAEYDEAKQEQAFVEGRIQELERLLAYAKVIEEPTTKGDYVRMGAHVTVVDPEGDRETYYLVGSSEADPRKGLISNESPIGRALIGKRLGDEVTVVAPAGAFTLKIIEIN